ncbi:MAG: RND transporter [Candidatus Electrothrix sp. ATG1]|nr:RND transporter [Candidatus Electrothrix sp. ATG1]MCI5207953.1 RND transporter [Candidatus Electrothrix sp. ATG2]
MKKIGEWLDRLPLAPLVVIALLLGSAPVIPEPHLVEKIRMLISGTLVRPIDIFDLFFHAAPLCVLLLKLIRLIHNASNNRVQTDKE